MQRGAAYHCHIMDGTVAGPSWLYSLPVRGGTTRVPAVVSGRLPSSSQTETSSLLAPCASVARKCFSSPVSSISVTVTSARPCSPKETCSLLAPNVPLRFREGDCLKCHTRHVLSLLYFTTQLNGRGKFRQGEDLRFPRLNIITARDKPFRCVEVLLSALLRCWKETTVYNNDVYLLPKELLNLVASLVPSRYRCWRSLYCSGALLVSESTWSAQKAWTTRKSTTIDLVSSEGLDDTKVDNDRLGQLSGLDIKPQVDRFVFPSVQLTVVLQRRVGRCSAENGLVQVKFLHVLLRLRCPLRLQPSQCDRASFWQAHDLHRWDLEQLRPRRVKVSGAHRW